MGNVDQADQLRLQYRIHYWIRNRKWCWAMFFWTFELSLMNCYVLFKKFYKIHERKPPYSHYEFVKRVALAWLNPSEHWQSSKSSRGRIVDDSTTVQSSIASSVVAKKRIKFEQKNCVLTDNSLDFYTGNLRCRLDTSLNHLPTMNNKPENNCQLYYWHDKSKYRAQLMKCMLCNVTLCISCYKAFHEVPFLKSNIINK
mgnify:FL=1